MLKSCTYSIAVFICVVKLVLVSGNHIQQKCRKNEVLSHCVNRVCEYRRCADLGKPIQSVQVDPAHCKKGYICKDNYLRADNGTCIPANQCPNGKQPSICGPDEVYESCVNGGCGLWNCSQPAEICISLIEGGCIEGCHCKDGFLRTDDGICVPEDQCPLTCTGPNEYFSDDGCRGVCLCEEGYIRDDTETCVPISECQEPCGENEVATSCFEAICERRNCSDLNNSVICVRIDPRFCTNGCLCKEGYLRDENGICIPVDQCPNAQCGDNEVFDLCPPQCPGEKCGVDPSVTLCLPNPEPGDPSCQPGCRCQDNYFRNKAGFCVPKDQCPKPVICGPNEEHTDCANSGCGIWYCRQTQPICNLILDEDCIEGCYCKKGMLRAENGTCIPEDQCPPKCNGPHEYFSCGGTCDNVCATLSTQNQTNCPTVNKKCIPKCYCQEGYARDKNNVCIPINKCPPVCGINEVYDTCIPPCPPRRCDVDDRLIDCAPSPQPGDPDCQSGCRCADNFYRNYDNVCVPRSECPTCDGPNEYFACGGACDNVCDTLSTQNQTVCPWVNIKCNPMCYCEEGYARDSNKTCIPISQCPKKCPKNERPTSCIQARCERRDCSDLLKPILCARVDPKFCKTGCLCEEGFLRDENGKCVPINQCKEAQCKANEFFDICPPTCPGEKCGVDPKLVLCSPNPEPGDPSCQPGCRCSVGYLRNDKGYCVPEDKCPPVCKANEVYDTCIAPCPPRRCDVDERVIRCARPPQPGDPECKSGCRCADGFYKNDNNDCVPRNECPGKQPLICGPDEIYSSCVNGGCGRWNCSQPGEICIKLAEGACKEGCHCRDGLLRTDDGICVPANECPVNCFGQNEVRGCHRTCPPQTCEFADKKIFCPRQTKECKEECRCKEGFFRNKIYECISKEDCLKCTGPNEYFSCGGACDNVCSDLSVQNQTNCPIENIKCNPKCYCIEGYARDKNGTCIAISKCPKPVCGVNEIFDDCPATCPPRTCDASNRAYKCKPQPKSGDPECKPGCRCADGYYKDKKGVCVPKNKCPKPPGVVCGPDEVYNSCANGGCGRWNCSQPGIICIDLIEGGCKEGCRCKEGLLKTANGTCVPEDQCPLNCFGQNEVSGCKTTCPETCDVIGKKYSCPLQSTECIPKCRCKKGYFKNKIDECISEEDCLKCTGPNEYFSCGVACDNVCRTLAVQNQTNCPLENIKCNPMCYCVEGYARDNNGTCVPISLCPPTPKCGKNEVFNECPPIFPPERCDFDPSASGACEENPKPGDPRCKPSCRCVDNYLRNQQGQCVSKDQCNVNNTTTGLKDFEQGTIVFTEKFLYEVAKAKPGVSLIFSPFSVLFILAQLTLYSVGGLLEQLLKILNLKSKDEIRSVIPRYLDSLYAPQNITLDIAQKVYANKNYQLSEAFIRDSKEVMKAEAQTVDICNNSDAAARTMNEWVERQTNNLIKNLVSPDTLSCDTTVLVLINAIYFKGNWKNKFDPKNTMLQKFYANENKEVEVKMMRRTGSYKYTQMDDDLQTQVIQLPYENEDYSFLLWLPQDKNGINNLIDKFKDSSYSINNTLSSMRSRPIDLSMPAFNTATTTNLKDLLAQAFGLQPLFDANKSELSGILEGSVPTYVTNAIQKANVTVQETGSEAAAATAIGVSATAVQQNSEMTADHPFIYIILHKVIPIFCGIFYGDTS